MGRVKNVRGRAKRPEGIATVLHRLEPGEAKSVLDRLLTAHPELVAEADQIARLLLGEVSFESVADEVEDSVRALDSGHLHSRAGRHEWGYVEPGEAAWELLEEAVEPFVEDMKRQIDLGLETEALEICKGIVLGMYRFRDEIDNIVLGYAPDFPAETAACAISDWRTGGEERRVPKREPREHPPFPRDFVDEFVSEWDSLITRVLSRT